MGKSLWSNSEVLLNIKYDVIGARTKKKKKWGKYSFLVENFRSKE